MGLDMYLEKKSKNWKQKMLASLENKEEYEEVRYWRKCYQIHDWFCDNFEVENCEYAEVSKEELLQLVEYLKEEEGDDYFKPNEEIKQLNKIITETDWDNEEIYYYAWW